MSRKCSVNRRGVWTPICALLDSVRDDESGPSSVPVHIQDLSVGYPSGTRHSLAETNGKFGPQSVNS